MSEITDDPVTQEDETVKIKRYSSHNNRELAFTFPAAVDSEGSAVSISPVPERAVGPSLPYTVELECESAPDGKYLCTKEKQTLMDTVAVVLVDVDDVNNEPCGDADE